MVNDPSQDPRAFPALPGERRLHAGCGFLFGVTGGVLGVALGSSPTWRRAILVGLASGILAAVLAMVLRERFWRWPGRWMDP